MSNSDLDRALESLSSAATTSAQLDRLIEDEERQSAHLRAAARAYEAEWTQVDVARFLHPPTDDSAGQMKAGVTLRVRTAGEILSAFGGLFIQSGRATAWDEMDRDTVRRQFRNRFERLGDDAYEQAVAVAEALVAAAINREAGIGERLAQRWAAASDCAQDVLLAAGQYAWYLAGQLAGELTLAIRKRTRTEIAEQVRLLREEYRRLPDWTVAKLARVRFAVALLDYHLGREHVREDRPIIMFGRSDSCTQAIEKLERVRDALLKQGPAAKTEGRPNGLPLIPTESPISDEPERKGKLARAVELKRSCPELSRKDVAESIECHVSLLSHEPYPEVEQEVESAEARSRARRGTM